MKPLRKALLVPKRENRVVDSTVQKVPKMPVDMRMLTYESASTVSLPSAIEQAQVVATTNTTTAAAAALTTTVATNSSNTMSTPSDSAHHTSKHEPKIKRSNVSSADSKRLNRLANQLLKSEDSFDTVGNPKQDNNSHSKDKTSKTNKSTSHVNQQQQQQQQQRSNNEQQAAGGVSRADEAAAMAQRNVDSFFMTQIEQVDDNYTHRPAQHRATKHHQTGGGGGVAAKAASNKVPAATTTTLNGLRSFGDETMAAMASSGADTTGSLDFDMLLDIENEESIKVPRDLRGSLRELKHMLDGPHHRRNVAPPPPPQPAVRQNMNNQWLATPYQNTQQQQQPQQDRSKLTQINEILDTLRERKTISELDLTEAINRANNNDSKFERAKLLFDNVRTQQQQMKLHFFVILMRFLIVVVH